MSKSKIFFYFCISFVAGIIIGQIFQPAIPVVFILAISLVSIFYTDKRFVFVGLCVISFGIGAWRAQSVVFRINNNELAKYIGKDVSFKAIVVAEPQKTEKSLRLTLKSTEGINGKILITTTRYPEYKYNDILDISGKLEIPEILNGFNYQKYLEKDGIYAVMVFPKIELIGHGKTNIYEQILFFKEKLREGIQKNFSPPYSLVLEGMILGDSGALGDDLKNKLNITGLRHIIAISGTHIVILSSILMSFFIAIGLWRSQAFYLSIFSIIIYIILSGSPASGIRSLIMGGIFMYGQKIGRKSASGRTIVIAGALMLLINPLLLFYDAGFQLSFLACLGMIYLSPVFENYLKVFFKERFVNLRSMISATLSAQVFTLPIMIYSFGNISLISIITNILVLPVVYPLMVLGFLASFFSAFFDLISWVFILPSWFFLWYFIKVIDVFSIPFFMIQVKNIHWMWIAISYLLLFYFLYEKKLQDRSF